MLDNFCRVNVSILNRPAAWTVVDAVAQRLRRHQSAAVAFLGSPARVDLDHDATGTFRLVARERDQLTPCGIENGLGEYASCQSSDVQILEGDVRIAVDQGTGQLVRKVPPLVSRPGTVTRKVPLRLEPALAPRFASGKGTLKTTLFLGRFGNPLRRWLGIPVRRGDQTGQSDINANHGSERVRPVGVRSFDCEADIPLAAGPGDNSRQYLGVGREFSVPPDLDLAGNANNAEFLGFADCQPVPNPKLGTVPSALGLKARKSAFAILDPAEERLECFVEAADDSLFCAEAVAGESLIDSTNFLQLVGLIVETERLFPALVGFNALLEACVIKFAEAAEHVCQPGDLRVGWIQAIFVGQDGHRSFSFAVLINDPADQFGNCDAQPLSFQLEEFGLRLGQRDHLPWCGAHVFLYSIT